MRTHLREAFHLHQLNHDEIPDTAEELRTRNARIVQLCEWAEDLLDDRTAALAEPIARARRAPEIIAGVRADAARLRARIPHARDTVERLARALLAPRRSTQVEPNPAEAEQLLGFAEHSAGVAERRREAGQREQANLALEACDRGGAPRRDAPRRRRDLRGRGAARRVHARGDRRGLPRRPRRRAQGARTSPR